MPYLDELTPRAQAVGSVNTTKIVEKDGKTIHIGTNLDIQAILNSLRQALTGTASPFDASVPSEFREGQAAALVIGGGGATRAAIYALHTMKLSPIYILNRDSAETQAIIKQFPTIDLRELTSVDQAKAELKELEAKGTRFCVGVGCIPSVEPASEGEKMVYDVARALFSHPYPAVGGDNEGTQHFSIPEKPIFFDMAYKPIMTLLRVMAEELGWRSESGVGIVAENCFEQAEWWLGLSVSAKDREAIRKVVRDRQ
ncbi:NAD(P)-binding protein [Cystobasidium minutum MCA 4210]|uniref:NAD(P)-binding protein n=1 Tax=Cystobasidium minutum MCA 4210 TaxID=1397322 RepID=UPI0034CE75A2|eukprot:jgi/Rhomi1/174060/fgenesh1_kg.7_\